jgi:hypothetical protein
MTKALENSSHQKNMQKGSILGDKSAGVEQGLITNLARSQQY